jgi:hypothetical protein
MTPVVADYRARNLLFLRVPATARVPVTAEVAILVVPAIYSQELTESAPFSRGHKKAQNRYRK